MTLAFVLAHNILYTYIAPFLDPAGMSERIDVVLLVFGVTLLFGIWIVGVLIDRRLRQLVLVSTFLFRLSALALGLWGTVPAVVYGAIGIWGLAFGGAAMLFQTASAKAAGEAADIAQSMLVTTWNIAIAGGGLVGGLLLESFGVASFPWAIMLLLTATLVLRGARKNMASRAPLNKIFRVRNKSLNAFAEQTIDYARIARARIDASQSAKS